MNVKNILKNYDDKICDVSVQALSNGVDTKSYKQYLPGQPPRRVSEYNIEIYMYLRKC